MGSSTHPSLGDRGGGAGGFTTTPDDEPRLIEAARVNGGTRALRSAGPARGRGSRSVSCVASPSTPGRHRVGCESPGGRGESELRGGDIVLRPGPDGALLVPDRTHPRAFTLRVGRTDQSYVDLDDPLRLEFDYVQRLADIIDQLAPPGQRIRVVHVGGAGLTLPRYVTATRPQSAQLVFEPDTELTDFVRIHLPLPPRSGIKVRADGGRPGVAGLREAYADLIVVDAFVGARVPADLTSEEFLADARRVLDPAGTLLINVTDRGPFGYARRVLAGLVEVFPHAVFCAEPSTIKGRRFGNVILAGSGRPLPVAAIAQRAGSSPFPYRVLHGARLTQLIAGAAGFCDEDGEQSPEPPSGLGFFG